MISSPVVIADHDGDRYLVAMLGDEASWPRNARVAGGEVVLRHGRHETVYLVELPADRRAAVVRRYLEVAPGARAYFPIDRHAQLEERRRSRDRSPFPVVVGHLALVAGRF